MNDKTGGGVPMKTNKEIFAKRLKMIMSENKVTAKELSGILNVTADAVYNWTRGQNSITKENLEKICDFFGCDKDWLSGQDVDKHKSDKKNASGYTDRTMYTALKHVDEERKKTMHNLRKGDIFEYITASNETRYALVISDETRADKRTVAIIMLGDYEGVEVRCNDRKYANPCMVSYGFVDKFSRLVRVASKEEMDAVDDAIRKCSGINITRPVISTSDSSDMNEIKEKIVQLKRMSEESKAENESLRAEIKRLTDENEELKNRNIKPSNDDSTKAELYKGLYEYLLEKMIGGKIA